MVENLYIENLCGDRGKYNNSAIFYIKAEQTPLYVMFATSLEE